MKKLLLTCGVLALLGGASYAQAQPIDPEEGTEAWVHSTTTLTKTVSTLETIVVDTTVTISQLVTVPVDDAAEASAVGDQTNQNNKDCGNCAEKLDVIDSSSDNNAGLTSVNQAGGNDNNQGTLVSVAVDTFVNHPHTFSITTTTQGGPTTGTDEGFAHAQAEATQINGIDPTTEGEFNSPNSVEAIDLQFRDAVITNSGNSDVGLMYINQATGNNDNQLNELSLAFSARATGAAIAESDLGQFNFGNTVGEGADTVDPSSPSSTAEIGIHKAALVTSSLNNNIGVFGVNQSVGNNGNQANLVSIAAVGSNLPSF